MCVKRNNKGFSLIDVVCATAILALVALPICSGFLTAARSNQRIQEKTEIINMLNNELSLILASGELTLDGGVVIDLETVEFSGDPLKLVFKDSENQQKDLPESLEKQTATGEMLKITLTPKQAIAKNTRVAYIDIMIEIYEVYEPENKVIGEQKVSGVWAE
jgi:type II secretory pathway pseudopilin PulG